MRKLFQAFQKIVSYFFVLVFIFGCASVPKGGKDNAQKNNLKDLCRQYDVQWRWDSVAQVVTLDKNGKKAKVLVGSSNVIFDNRTIVLSGDVEFKRSAIIVPSDFKEKVIDLFIAVPPSIKSMPLVLRKVRQVIIDPGHGGKDPGAIGRTGLYEKKVVLDIARRLKTILKHHGFDVVMTRDSDEFIALNERTEIASRKKGDLFVSVHANSHPSAGTYGLEVYASNNLNFSERNEAQRKINEDILFNQLKVNKNVSPVEGILSDMLYSYKEAQSMRLASIVANETTKMTDTKNLGTKQARFFVLRNTLIPAILVEVGFLTNPKEERNLNTNLYRQKIASAIAKSIVRYSNE